MFKSAIMGDGSANDRSSTRDEHPSLSQTTVTETTDPVQTITWGPLVHVEASTEARAIAMQIRDAEKVALKLDKRRSGRTHSGSTTLQAAVETGDRRKAGVEQELVAEEAMAQGSRSQGSPNLKMFGVYKPPAATATHSEQVDNFRKGRVLSIASRRAAKSSSRRQVEPRPDLRRNNSRAPPSTPPDQPLYQSLSTPTLPGIHPMADVALVEEYCTERAQDIQAFDGRTSEIKRGLLMAKLKRGGVPRLEQNEYTVELASREAAQRTDEWTRRKTSWDAHEHESDPPSEQFQGIFESVHPMNNGVHGSEQELESNEAEGVRPLQTHEVASPRPPYSSLRLQRLASEDNASPEREAASLIPSGFVINDHVAKTSKSGTIHVRRNLTAEKTEEGTKQVMKTWLEITETVETASKDQMGWKEVVEAIEQDGGWKKERKRRVERNGVVETNSLEDDETDDHAESIDGNSDSESCGMAGEVRDILKAVRVVADQAEAQELAGKTRKMAEELEMLHKAGHLQKL